MKIAIGFLATVFVFTQTQVALADDLEGEITGWTAYESSTWGIHAWATLKHTNNTYSAVVLQGTTLASFGTQPMSGGFANRVLAAFGDGSATARLLSLEKVGTTSLYLMHRNSTVRMTDFAVPPQVSIGTAASGPLLKLTLFDPAANTTYGTIEIPNGFVFLHSQNAAPNQAMTEAQATHLIVSLRPAATVHLGNTESLGIIFHGFHRASTVQITN